MILVGLIILSLALGLTAWLAFVWSVKSGQYDDPEGPKYRMLEEEEEPPRAAPKAGTPDGGDRDSAPPRSPRGTPKA